MESSPPSSMSEQARIEQVITEFFSKSLHIILETRSPYVSSRNYCGDRRFAPSPFSSSPSSLSGLPRDKWFSLALRDCPAVLENFDLWQQSNFDPLIVDVILIQRQSKGPWMEHKSEKIVERWIVKYETWKSNNFARELNLGGRRDGGGSGGSISHSSESSSVDEKIDKITTILLQSLYCTVRLLPAYKVFRDLNSSWRITPFSLAHKISSFTEPFTRDEDADINHFSFLPVDTSCGRISLSVSYAPKLEDVSSEPSMSLSVEFIPDYVGSPTTEKLRRLCCLPSGRSLPTYVLSNRRHSWSNDHVITPCASPSPSPTYSDSRNIQCSRNIGLPPRTHPPDCLPSTCLVPHITSPFAHKKNMTFDEYWTSPPFSLSSSPSPPTHLPGNHLQNVLLRSESAPLSVLLPRGLANQALPTSLSRRSGKAECSSQEDTFRAQVTTASPYHTSSPENKLQLMKRPVDIYIDTHLQKMLYSGIDEVRSLSGWKIPSRSSTRFSLLDEFDCPFAVDDEDLGDPCRVEISDADSHAGDSASGELIPVSRLSVSAVGALVRMLKAAAPLRQDFTNLVSSSQANKEEAWTMKGMQHNKDKEDEVMKTAQSTAPELFVSRMTSDALEERRCYREVKESILHKRGSQQFDMGQARKPDSDVSKGGLQSLSIGQTEKSVSEGIEDGHHSLLSKAKK